MSLLSVVHCGYELLTLPFPSVFHRYRSQHQVSDYMNAKTASVHLIQYRSLDVFLFDTNTFFRMQCGSTQGRFPRICTQLPVPRTSYAPISHEPCTNRSRGARGFLCQHQLLLYGMCSPCNVLQVRLRLRKSMVPVRKRQLTAM